MKNKKPGFKDIREKRKGMKKTNNFRLNLYNLRNSSSEVKPQIAKTFALKI